MAEKKNPIGTKARELPARQLIDDLPLHSPGLVFQHDQIIPKLDTEMKNVVIRIIAHFQENDNSSDVIFH